MITEEVDLDWTATDTAAYTVGARAVNLHSVQIHNIIHIYIFFLFLLSASGNETVI